MARNPGQIPGDQDPLTRLESKFDRMANLMEKLLESNTQLMNFC